jgi:hypothetical protein
MSHEVFVSYSSADRHIAEAAAAALERGGVRCWIAPRNIPPGSDWGEAIVRAIHESGAMVLIFSASANLSQQVKREVNIAVGRNLPVVPFRIDNVEPSGTLEYYLRVTHWLDARPPPPERHLAKLVGAVKALLDSGGVPKPPAPSPAPSPARWRVLAGVLVSVVVLSAAAGGFLLYAWGGGGESEDSDASPPAEVGAVPRPSAATSTPVANSYTPPATPTPSATPQATPQVTPQATPQATPTPIPVSGKLELRLNTTEDTYRAYNFFEKHKSEKVVLNIVFALKGTGGVTEIYRGGVIVADLKCDECEPGTFERLMFRIKAGTFILEPTPDGFFKLQGSFIITSIGGCTQGNWCVNLTPEN